MEDNLLDFEALVICDLAARWVEDNLYDHGGLCPEAKAQVAKALDLLAQAYQSQGKEVL